MFSVLFVAINLQRMPLILSLMLRQALLGENFS